MSLPALMTYEKYHELYIAAEMYCDSKAADILNQPFTFDTKSPIEEKLAYAILRVAPYRDVPEVYKPQRDLFVSLDPEFMFRMETQVPIGRYVADILLSRDNLRVVVECDGHEFHERTREQAEHDKRRDRRLQAGGYRVLRFTGSEICRDPNAAALEVLETALVLAIEDGG